MMIFKFGRYYKRISLFVDGHHNGITPLRNIPPRPRHFSLGHRTPEHHSYPDQTQFIRITNNLIDDANL